MVLLVGRCFDPVSCELSRFVSAEENLRQTREVGCLLPQYSALISPACSGQGQRAPVTGLTGLVQEAQPAGGAPNPPPLAPARQPLGWESPRWPLCSAAKQREWTVQCGARRGETRAGSHRAGGREGQQCGSRLEDSPLKAMQTSKTGPVASVLEDAKIFSEKPTPS